MPTELSLSYTDTLIVTWSFLFEVKCYHSYIVCYTKHKLSYVLKIKATFLLHTSAGVLCFNWIQNELLKLEVCIFIQQKIKTNALLYVGNPCSTFFLCTDEFLTFLHIEYSIFFLYLNFRLRMNVDDFPCLAVVYHHWPIRFS